jgi:hypothetical protein
VVGHHDISSEPGSESHIVFNGKENDPYPHELHFIDVPDELCKVQLKERSKNLPAGSAWTSDAEFDAITAYFQPPTMEEGFNVILHRRT